MKHNKKIFLFDMDGTLTPPRLQVEGNIIRALRKLSQYTKIGIVTGSDMEYVEQQMMRAFDIGGVPVNSVDILPCNGTKRYVATKSNRFSLDQEVNMIKEIGSDSYRKIVKFCLESQAEIVSKYEELPYTGTFLQYRGSLLNWCPIGRSADQHQREQLVKLDHETSFRDLYAKSLRGLLLTLEIPVTVALGGSTSLDIYPDGWDKTYSMKYYEGWDVYFAGDRCEEGGNDWHIYEKLKDQGRSFSVESTDDTIRIIEEFIAGLS